MKDKIIVSMSSFNRLGYCLDAVLNIRRQDRNIPIVIAVEQEQYQLYKTLLNRYAYVFPLPEKLKGIGYSTYYSLKLMRDLNYRYVLRCDDDTMIKFKPEIMLDVFSKHKDTAWVAGWVSYYDWGYRKYAQNKDGTVECTIASQCYALDLNKIEELKNWDWTLRTADDIDMALRIHLSGYKMYAYKKALMRVIAISSISGNGGGVASSLGNYGNVIRIKAVKYLREKYGDCFIHKLANVKGQYQNKFLLMRAKLKRKDYSINYTVFPKENYQTDYSLIMAIKNYKTNFNTDIDLSAKSILNFKIKELSIPFNNDSDINKKAITVAKYLMKIKEYL
jgi:hypothetical protein